MTFRLDPALLIDATPEDAKTKAAAVNGFVRLVEADFPQRLLTKQVYRLLTTHLNMSAQYDSSGFHHYWLSTPDARVDFMAEVWSEISHHWLSPRHRLDLWDDVKALLCTQHDFSNTYDGRAGQAWFEQQQARLAQAAKDHLEATEREELARLLGVYGVPDGWVGERVA